MTGGSVGPGTLIVILGELQARAAARMATREKIILDLMLILLSEKHHASTE
jgi:hypothetical protein